MISSVSSLILESKNLKESAGGLTGAGRSSAEKTAVMSIKALIPRGHAESWCAFSFVDFRFCQGQTCNGRRGGKCTGLAATINGS
jgi:hypothetical protein